MVKGKNRLVLCSTYLHTMWNTLKFTLRHNQRLYLVQAFLGFLLDTLEKHLATRDIVNETNDLARSPDLYEMISAQFLHFS
jgi:hypothetical protein